MTLCHRYRRYLSALIGHLNKSRFNRDLRLQNINNGIETNKKYFFNALQTIIPQNSPTKHQVVMVTSRYPQKKPGNNRRQQALIRMMIL